MPTEPEASRAVAEDLTPVLYDELRRIARVYFRNLRPGFTLCPTELVNEACLHLLQHAKGGWAGPEHFRAIATRKIWQVVVDHLRHRTAAKRGGTPAQSTAGDTTSKLDQPSVSDVAHLIDAGEDESQRQRQPLESIRVEWRDTTVDVLDLADALDDLAAQSPRLRECVMLHWFGGLKYAEVGRALSVSASTAEKDFHFALAWLSRRLAGNADVR